MEKELQIMADSWNKEAVELESNNQTEYDQCLFFQNKGTVESLRKCASDLITFINNKND